MSNNIYIALYISSHGFGHMTRCLAVVDYILKNSNYNIYIACDKNQNDFARIYLKDYSSRIIYKDILTDIGLINKKNSLELDSSLLEDAKDAPNKIEKLMEDVRIADSVEVIINLFRRANKYIDETTPWILAKNENEYDRLETVIYNLLETIRKGAILFEPFLPETSTRILEQLGTNNNNYNEVVDEYNVNKPYPLFERIDKEAKLKELEQK